MIAVYLFEPDPELHSGTERSSFSDKFRRPGPEPSVLSVNLAGSGPVMFFIDSRDFTTNLAHSARLFAELYKMKINMPDKDTACR